MAQNNLGVMYALGKGVTRNFTEAEKWYRLAAAQGNVKAQLSLGLIYEKGYGVAKNSAESIKWYRLAAYQGNAAAQNKLLVKSSSDHQ